MEAEALEVRLVACPGAMATGGMSSRPASACVTRAQVSLCQCERNHNIRTLGGARCDAMCGRDTHDRSDVPAISGVTMGTVTQEKLRERETESIYISPNRSVYPLPLTPPFPLRSISGSRPLSAASNHASVWVIWLCINPHKGWCTPWMYRLLCLSFCSAALLM